MLSLAVPAGNRVRPSRSTLTKRALIHSFGKVVFPPLSAQMGRFRTVTSWCSRVFSGKDLRHTLWVHRQDSPPRRHSPMHPVARFRQTELLRSAHQRAGLALRAASWPTCRRAASALGYRIQSRAAGDSYCMLMERPQILPKRSTLSMLTVVGWMTTSMAGARWTMTRTHGHGHSTQ